MTSTLNRSKILYILSRDFDYSKQIAPDVGPPIAEDYGWVPVKLSAEVLAFDGPIVVDNRLLPEETDWLRVALQQRKGPTFLRVCDDYEWENRDHWWYVFVREILARPVVGVVHTYTPREYVSSLIKTAGQTRFIHAPYVYQPERELSNHECGRRNRILFSGAINSEIYPERRQFLRKVRSSPLLSWYVRTLKHPGYPDIGQTQIHGITGRAYIEEVAKYRYAFVSPGRNSSEFLKYREFAYAGTCPVGHLPDSLADCPVDAFVKYNGSAWSFVANTIYSVNFETRARSFRAYMREKRERTRLREQVLARLRTALA